MSYLNKANGYEPTGRLNGEPNPREEILDEARGYVTKGDFEDNLKDIADIWSAQGVRVNGKSVSPADVALMMVGMNLARLKFNPDYRDSWADLIRYGAQVRAAQMKGWRKGDKANVDELVERQRDVTRIDANLRGSGIVCDDADGWGTHNRCGERAKVTDYDRFGANPHEAHSYADGAHWCDGYYRQRQSQQHRDVETVKRIADGLTKPRPIKDCPQA